MLDRIPSGLLAVSHTVFETTDWLKWDIFTEIVTYNCPIFLLKTALHHGNYHYSLQKQALVVIIKWNFFFFFNDKFMSLWYNSPSLLTDHARPAVLRDRRITGFCIGDASVYKGENCGFQVCLFFSSSSARCYKCHTRWGHLRKGPDLCQ